MVTFTRHTQIDKSIETETRVVVARARGRGRKRGFLLGMGFPFGVTKVF